MNAVEKILVDARKRIARPYGWTTGTVYEDGAFCSVGAIAAASSDNDPLADNFGLRVPKDAIRAYGLLKVCLERQPGLVDKAQGGIAKQEAPEHPILAKIADLNDKATKKQVLKAFTTAINYARRRHYNAD